MRVRSFSSLLCSCLGVAFLLLGFVFGATHNALAQFTNPQTCDATTGELCRQPSCTLTAGGCPSGYTGLCDKMGYQQCSACRCIDIDPDVTVECKCR
jgi:hypothetical protein